MTVTIYWPNPGTTDLGSVSDIGSIEIWRATSKEGTYSLLTSIGSDNDLGSFNQKYEDSTGSRTSWYRQRFMYTRGSGSEPDFFSGPQSPIEADLLCSYDEVKRLTGLTNEFTDIEIESYIVEADNAIFSKSNKPIDKTFTSLEDGEYKYDFTGISEPVYRVDTIRVSGSPLLGSDYRVDLADGSIEVGSVWVDTFAGERLSVEFVPIQFHLASKYKTAIAMLTQLEALSGENVNDAKIDRYVQTLGSLNLQGADAPGVITSTGGVIDKRQGRAIIQDFTGAFL